MSSQKTSHTSPTAPSTTKHRRQPITTATATTSGGVITAPMFEPQLNQPVASARSFLGNHSATVLTAAGKFPASPMPRMIRITTNPATVATRPCDMAATFHTRNVIASPTRVPTRSMNRPTNIIPRP